MHNDPGEAQVVKARNYEAGFHLAYQRCKPGVFVLENRTIPEFIPFMLSLAPFELIITDGAAQRANDGYLSVRGASFVIEVDPLAKKLRAVHMTDRLRSELSETEEPWPH